MTQYFSALSSTARVSRWLASSRSPRILHVFERACNLINEHREVLSVVAPEIGNGPFHVVVENMPPLADHINPESPLAIAPMELQIGKIRIQISSADVWDPSPNWEALRTAREAVVARLVTLPTGKTPNLQFSKSLATALANADTSLAIRAAQELAGLGQGLTPAGDDYIMGALYALWIIHPHRVAVHIAGEIAAVATLRTTSLSSAWLKAAAVGEAGIRWHKLFESAIVGERPVIQQQVSNILSVGATSGADAWAGFMDAILAYAAQEQKHVFSRSS